MVDVRDAPYAGICNPGTIPLNILGRYVPLRRRISVWITEMGEAILSGETISLRVVTDAGRNRVSCTSGAIIPQRDMKMAASIADAKFYNNNLYI
jgi:hypothetical protein